LPGGRESCDADWNCGSLEEDREAVGKAGGDGSKIGSMGSVQSEVFGGTTGARGSLLGKVVFATMFVVGIITQLVVVVVMFVGERCEA
jgi:hypothetical protein